MRPIERVPAGPVLPFAGSENHGGPAPVEQMQEVEAGGFTCLSYTAGRWQSAW
jgi:hypothetical protein